MTQEDLPYIVSDVLKHDAPEDKVKLISYVVSTAYGLKPGANIKVEINGKQYDGSAVGDGQYDAFVKALRYIYKKYLNRTFPILANYQVSIPPGGRTDALVQTVILTGIITTDSSVPVDWMPTRRKPPSKQLLKC